MVVQWKLKRDQNAAAFRMSTSAVGLSASKLQLRTCEQGPGYPRSVLLLRAQEVPALNSGRNYLQEEPAGDPLGP